MTAQEIKAILEPLLRQAREDALYYQKELEEKRGTKQSN